MLASYQRGLRHGLPIALGYLSVSFAFGIQATSLGLTPLQAVMISFFNVTSAGQLAGLQLMAAGAGPCGNGAHAADHQPAQCPDEPESEPEAG